MISELKKSISSVLYERMDSPLYGSFLISWSIWNWKVFYVTFFISEGTLDVNKLEYVYQLLSNYNFSIWLPIISTITLVCLMPFVSNIAFLISLTYDDRRRNMKNRIEKNQLLTIEQSTKVREEIEQQKNRFTELFEAKESEIASLKAIIADLRKTKESAKNTGADKLINSNEDLYEKDYQKLARNNIFKENILTIARYIQSGYSPIKKDVNSQAVSLLIGYSAIEKAGGGYDFTDKGKYFLRRFQEEN